MNSLTNIILPFSVTQCMVNSVQLHLSIHCNCETKTGNIFMYKALVIYKDMYDIIYCSMSDRNSSLCGEL